MPHGSKEKQSDKQFKLILSIELFQLDTQSTIFYFELFNETENGAPIFFEFILLF